MVDDSQQGYVVQELNREILSTTFGIQTRYHVITGSSCSGKTTLIEGMAEAGYHAPYLD